MTPRPRIVIHPDAMAEGRDGWRWYRARSPDTAARFQAEIDDAMERIRQTPRSWPVFEDDTRRYMLRRFPYAVIYRLHDETVEVLAIAHLRRRPGYWRNRE